jgi:DNA-binding PadR family transcriptional regulator
MVKHKPLVVKNKPHDIGTLSPEMALLGLLYEAPGYGYELHRKVVADLGHVWHLSQSQAYSILKRLLAQGDISMEELPQKKLPARQLLHMTPQGTSRFLDWLDSPSRGSNRAIRLEFISRLYILRLYMPEKISQAFDQQRQEAESRLQQLTNTLSELPEEQIYNRMSVDLRIKQLQTILKWLAVSQKYFRQK